MLTVHLNSTAITSPPAGVSRALSCAPARGSVLIVQRLIAEPLPSFSSTLVAVMPERLDAVSALLGVEVALAEDGPRRLDALLDLELWYHLHAPAGGGHLVSNAPPCL